MKTQKKDEKTKGRLLGILFTLMMADFLTTFIAVGFLGFIEINFIPKVIISLFGFWWWFGFIILIFFVLALLADLNYKNAMRTKKTYWMKFLGLYFVISIYIITVFLNLLNIISVLK